MSARNFPAEFGRYRLTGLLGAGGMAEVYRAETQPVAGITRQVAIKRLFYGTSDAALSNMLLDEARIWVRLQHPNIVTVFEFGEAEGDFFLALELVEGVTAADLVRDDGPLPEREALCIGERVARALDYAHKLDENGRPLGIVHRDVKPANILVSKRGDVKLTDFGIARAVDRVTRTQVGFIKGSAAFMSPEQIREEPLDGRSDIFSLACTLHILMTGAPLLDKPREALLIAIAKGQIPSPPKSMSEPVRALLSAMLAARREDRPASMAEVAKRIRGILQPELVEDIEPALGARTAISLQKIDTVRAIKAAQNTSETAPAPKARADQAERAAPAAPARSKPLEPVVVADAKAVVPRRPADHPSWGAVDESLLPQDDNLEKLEREADRRRLERDSGSREPVATERAVREPKPAEREAARAAAPRGMANNEPSTEKARLVTGPVLASRRPRAQRRDLPPDAAAATAVNTTGARRAGGALSRVFEIAPRMTRKTSKALRESPLHWKIAIGAFGISIVVIALLLAPKIAGLFGRAGCGSAQSTVAGIIRERSFDAGPDVAKTLAQHCAGDPVVLRTRLRLLSLAGDFRGAQKLLPAAEERSPEQRLDAAALEMSQRDFRGAEADAWAIAREGKGEAVPEARCLAAAAAIDGDHPERVDGYLTSANDDCARILRAAAALTSSGRAAALSFLARPPQQSRLEASYQSALGVVHLLANDMESTLADAKAADDRAGDGLSERPWIWYSMPSPRGAETNVLRLSGPLDDPTLYTRILLGDSARVRGNYDLALKLYDQALARGGRNAIADLRSATVYLKQGKPPLARSKLQHALTREPGFAPALVALALIEEHDSDPVVRAQAVQHASAALAGEPENRDARRIAGR